MLLFLDYVSSVFLGITLLYSVVKIVKRGGKLEVYILLLSLLLIQALIGIEVESFGSHHIVLFYLQSSFLVAAIFLAFYGVQKIHKKIAPSHDLKHEQLDTRECETSDKYSSLDWRISSKTFLILLLSSFFYFLFLAIGVAIYVSKDSISWVLLLPIIFFFPYFQYRLIIRTTLLLKKNLSVTVFKFYFVGLFVSMFLSLLFLILGECELSIFVFVVFMIFFMSITDLKYLDV